MHYLLLLLSDYNYPFLKEMLVDVRMHGVEVKPFASSQLTLLEQALKGEDVKDRALVITDSAAGIKCAGLYDTACIFYENGDNDVYYKKDIYDPDLILQGFDEVDTRFLIRVYQRHHKIPWTILRTERLTLREMTVDDVDRLYEIYEEPSITLYTEPLYKDRDEEVAYTRDYIRNEYGFYGYGMWLVTENETGRIVGRAGITNRAGFKEAELGYVIEKSRQGRGYATEACRAIIDYAGAELSMDALNCFIQDGNEVSARLCDRLGFKYLEDTPIGGMIMHRYYIKLGGDHEGEDT